MRVAFRHAWMQKHPSPTARSGDFHWHPPGIPGAIRATLTELSTRARGQKSSLWIVDREYAAWARTFAATAPGDQRRYTGLAVTIAQPAGQSAGQPGAGSRSSLRSSPRSSPGASARAWSEALPEVLARLPLAAAAPHGMSAGSPEQPDLITPRAEALHDTPGAATPLAVDPSSLRSLFGGNTGDRGGSDSRDRARNQPGQLARAMILGGQVSSCDPHAARLPALVGRLLSWLPASYRARPRTGVFTTRPGEPERHQIDPGMDNFLHYLAGAWYCPEAIRAREPGYAQGCWQLVFELAAMRTPGAAAGLDLPELFADLTRVAHAWDTAKNLYDYLIERGTLSRSEIAACNGAAPSPLYTSCVSDAGWLWNRLLHYWGRRYLPEGVLPRLADLLARRIAVDHLFYLDTPDDAALPRRYLRRLRYEALLPSDRVAAMLNTVKQTLPSLGISTGSNLEVRFG